MNNDESIDALLADGSTKPHLRNDEARVFNHYAAIVRRLRAPDGCPWDKKQTVQTLRASLIDEAFEVIAAINDNNPTDIREELGDVMLVLLLLSDALEHQHGITLSRVLQENGAKLIRRHPHVFHNATAETSEAVVAQWDEIKRTVERRSTAVDAVPSGLPPLARAYEVQKKAAKLGFDWDTIDPVLAKIEEELDELRREISHAKESETPLKNNPLIEGELGDLYFAVTNVARHLQDLTDTCAQPCDNEVSTPLCRGCAPRDW